MFNSRPCPVTMISPETREMMKKDLTKGVMALALFALSLSRANFGTAESNAAPTDDASTGQLINFSEDIKWRELMERVFAYSDNTAAMACFACSIMLLLMTLLKQQDKVKRLLVSSMMVLLTLAGLVIMLSDMSSWACGIRLGFYFT